MISLYMNTYFKLFLDINAPENQGDLPGMTAKNFEIKFEWQKNAPRDSHFNGMGEVRNSIFNHKE